MANLKRQEKKKLLFLWHNKNCNEKNTIESTDIPNILILTNTWNNAIKINLMTTFLYSLPTD